jgi:hypothetical protein
MPVSGPVEPRLGGECFAGTTLCSVGVSDELMLIPELRRAQAAEDEEGRRRSRVPHPLGGQDWRLLLCLLAEPAFSVAPFCVFSQSSIAFKITWRAQVEGAR